MMYFVPSSHHCGLNFKGNENAPKLEQARVALGHHSSCGAPLKLFRLPREVVSTPSQLEFKECLDGALVFMV